MTSPPERASISWQIPLWGLFTLALIFTLYAGAPILRPLFIVMLVAAALAAPTTWLSARIPRTLAAALVIVPAIMVILASAYFVAEPVTKWMNSLPQIMREIEADLRGVQTPLKDVGEVAASIEQIGKDGPPPVEVKIQEPLSTSLGSLVGTVITTAFGLILLYFALAFGDRVILNFARLFGSKGNVTDIVRNVQRELGTYLLTITAINMGLGVVTGASLAVVGMPDPELWGFMAALMNFIPFAGSLIGVAVVGLVGYAHAGHWELPLVAIIVYYGLTQIESNLVTPMILGRSMRLNPLCVLLAIAFWGWLWGIIGAIIAVPLLAATKVVTERFERTRGVAQLLSG